jgi:hypothetical protein
LFFSGGSIVTKDRNAELLWKQIVRGYLPDAMDFFFPEISKLVDWRSPPVFLDRELEQFDPDDEYGKRDAMELKDDPQEMKNWKLLLVRGLHEKGYKDEQIKDLLILVDGIDTFFCRV